MKVRFDPAKGPVAQKTAAIALAKTALAYVSVNGKRPPKHLRLDGDERMYDRAMAVLKAFGVRRG